MWIFFIIFVKIKFMYKVGLSGNFESGYNKVAKLFEGEGILVFDADTILRFMVNYSPKHIKEIKKAFGNSIYNFGLLDMKKIQSNKEFDDILDLLQKDLMKAYEKWRIKNWNCVYTIFKSQILFERKINQSMDFNISVYRPSIERRYQIQESSSMPITTIDNILRNEMCELDKNKKSDFVIHNYSFHDLKKQIDNINKAILKKNYHISQSI